MLFKNKIKKTITLTTFHLLYIDFFLLPGLPLAMEFALHVGTACSERCPLSPIREPCPTSLLSKNINPTFCGSMLGDSGLEESRKTKGNELKDKEATPVVLSACQECDRLFGLLAAAFLL